MEAQFQPNFVRVDDPMVNVDSRKWFPILKGGVETTERRVTTNNTNDAGISFSAPPPSPHTFVSRRMFLRMPIYVQIVNANANDEYGFQIGNTCLRAFPLASIMETLAVTINGQTVSINMREVSKPLLLFHDRSRMLNTREQSMSPTNRDFYTTYLNDSNASNRSNFTPLISMPGEHGHPRMGFPFEQWDVEQTGVDNTSNTSFVLYVITEELYLSPLLFGGVRDEGFIGVQSLDINITWTNDLTRIMSVKNATGLEITVSTEPIPGHNWGTQISPDMLFRYVTPPMDLPIPRSIQYSYNEIKRFRTNISTAIVGPDQDNSVIGNWANYEVTSNNIQLNSIPRFLYIFIQVDNKSPNDTDSYRVINSVRINWNNQSGLLSNATQQQLYDISRRHGIDLSFGEWTAAPSPAKQNDNGEIPFKCVNGIGSVLCVEFGTDIGLREDECAGMIGTYNLQVTVNYSQPVFGYDIDTADNANDAAITFPAGSNSLYLVTVTPGIFTIYDLAANVRLGVVDRQDVMMAPRMLGLDYDDLSKELMRGGFKFRPKKLFKKFKKGVSKVLPYAEQGLEMASPYLPAPYQEMAQQGISAAKGLVSNSRAEPQASMPKPGYPISAYAPQAPQMSAMQPQSQCPEPGGAMVAGRYYKRKRRAKRKNSKKKGGRPRKVGRPKKSRKKKR